MHNILNDSRLKYGEDFSTADLTMLPSSSGVVDPQASPCIICTPSTNICRDPLRPILGKDKLNNPRFYHCAVHKRWTIGFIKFQANTLQGARYLLPAAIYAKRGLNGHPTCIALLPIFWLYYYHSSHPLCGFRTASRPSHQHYQRSKAELYVAPKPAWPRLLSYRH